MDWGGKTDIDELDHGAPQICLKIAVACWMAAAIVGTFKFVEMIIRAVALD